MSEERERRKTDPLASKGKQEGTSVSSKLLGGGEEGQRQNSQKALFLDHPVSGVNQLEEEKQATVPKG